MFCRWLHVRDCQLNALGHLVPLLRRIIPTVVHRTQQLACGIIVEPLSTLVRVKEWRVGLRRAFHEPAGHQDLESVSILCTCTVGTLGELFLLCQSSMKVKEALNPPA